MHTWINTDKGWQILSGMSAPASGPGAGSVLQAGLNPAAAQLVGIWRLMSRTVTNADGERIAESALGEKPEGYLIYDASGHVAAQLMRPGRTAAQMKNCGAPVKMQNNSTSVCGYDAYFGTYKLADGGVVHHLELALSPDDIGKDIHRSFVIAGDQLTITFPTTLPDGKTVTRTVLWERVR